MRTTAMMLVLLVAILVKTADPAPGAEIEMVTEPPATHEPDTYTTELYDQKAAAILLAEKIYRASMESDLTTEEDARRAAEIAYREVMKGTIRVKVNTLH